MKMFHEHILSPRPQALTEHAFDQPIPNNAGEVDGWKDIPFRRRATWRREPLVPVGPFSPYSDLFTSSVYFGEHTNSPYRIHPIAGETLLTQFTRPSTAKRLQYAQSLLPESYFLVIFDAFRLVSVQSGIYSSYYDELRHIYPNLSDDQLSEETQKYVSLPSSNPNVPSPHNTGGAVDVAIVELDEDNAKRVHSIDNALRQWNYPDTDLSYMMQMERSMILRSARLLDFGTPFDTGTQSAALRAFEGTDTESARNRRLLYHVMTRAGFAAYEHEWWHFNDPKTQMGARALHFSSAEFRAAHLSKHNYSHEHMRRDHYTGVNHVQHYIDRVGRVEDIVGAHNISQPLALVAITQSLHGEIITTPNTSMAERISPRE